GQIGNERVVIGDFSHLPTRCKFIALMPQWDFLDFLAERARRYPSFRLEMECEGDDLLIENGRVVGVAARGPRGALDIRAALVIGADGRHSTVRAKARLESRDLGAPIDVLWMRVPKQPGDAIAPLGRIDTGRILVMLDRGDYWQSAFVIPKGGYDEVRRYGLEALRDEIARLSGLDRASRRSRTGTTSSSSPSPSTASTAGTGRACSASAMRRTPCRRSAASASISPSRTPLPPPICWCRCCVAAAASTTQRWRACSAGASCRRASSSACRS